MRKMRLRPSILLLVGYTVVNVIVFAAKPYGSQWHYESQTPVQIEVITPSDSVKSLSEIADILDSIDLAYGAREPTKIERFEFAGKQLIQLALLPSSVALAMDDFGAYMGPANSKQQAFTLSVKRRYNHLARFAVKKGLKTDGFLYLEEPSLSKTNGQSFASLRATASE